MGRETAGMEWELSRNQLNIYPEFTAARNVTRGRGHAGAESCPEGRSNGSTNKEAPLAANPGNVHSGF